MRANTIDFYSTAIAYLTGVVGNKPLASLDNPEARELVAGMKAERIDRRTKIQRQDHR